MHRSTTLAASLEGESVGTTQSSEISDALLRSSVPDSLCVVIMKFSKDGQCLLVCSFISLEFVRLFVCSFDALFARSFGRSSIRFVRWPL